jgi:hypothetical protein
LTSLHIIIIEVFDEEVKRSRPRVGTLEDYQNIFFFLREMRVGFGAFLR